MMIHLTHESHEERKRRNQAQIWEESGFLFPRRANKKDYEKRGRNGNVETCPYETRHRNNPGMARGWPSHDAKEERNASLSLSLFPFASPLLFLAPATIERKAGCSCTCCRTRLRSKFDRHPAGPGEKETIRNNKVEGTLVETLNVPRSSVPSKIRCIRECPVSAVRPSTRQVQGHPRLTKTTPPPPLDSLPTGV